MADALHPQTFLTYGINGDELPVKSGGPLRMRVARQIGYKSIKFVTHITLTDSMKKFGKGLGSAEPEFGYSVVCGNLARASDASRACRNRSPQRTMPREESSRAQNRRVHMNRWLKFTAVIAGIPVPRGNAWRAASGSTSSRRASRAGGKSCEPGAARYDGEQLEKYDRRGRADAAEKYDCKPTPGQITFGHLVLHVAQSNTLLCSKISGQAPPKEDELTETSGKDKIVAAIKGLVRLLLAGARQCGRLRPRQHAHVIRHPHRDQGAHDDDSRLRLGRSLFSASRLSCARGNSAAIGAAAEKVSALRRVNSEGDGLTFAAVRVN